MFFFIKESKQRSIRFQDDKADEKEDEPKAKPTTPLQAAMLKMAAEKAARIHEASAAKAKEEEVISYMYCFIEPLCLDR